MSNAFAPSLVSPKIWLTKIKCPVEDTGKYSVRPSTMPSRIATHKLKIRLVSPSRRVTRIPRAGQGAA